MPSREHGLLLPAFFVNFRMWSTRRTLFGLAVAAAILVLAGQMRMNTRSELGHGLPKRSHDSTARLRVEQAARAQAAEHFDSTFDVDKVIEELGKMHKRMPASDSSGGHLHAGDEKATRFAAPVTPTTASRTRANDGHVGGHDAVSSLAPDVVADGASTGDLAPPLALPLAQPLSAPVIITFKWNGGRLGNQIRSLACVTPPSCCQQRCACGLLMLTVLVMHTALRFISHARARTHARSSLRTQQHAVRCIYLCHAATI